MTEEQAKKLRAPFKPEQIGKLPKPTKKDNPKGRCNDCGGWHGLPAVHLDYVGHAAVTDRLLQVDPEWSWEPMATGANGEPLLTNGGLWIKLTVAGVSRPGFGDEGNGKGMKEVIGDAIRNAAMRFGVALDLWAKEDLSADESDEKADKPPQRATGRSAAPKLEPEFRIPGTVGGQATEQQRAVIDDLLPKVAKAHGKTEAEVIEGIEATFGRLADLTTGKADELTAKLQRWLANAEKSAA